MNASHPYERGLGKHAANYVALSPLTFLERAASVYPDKVACVHQQRRVSWGETYVRCCQLSDALTKRGIGLNDTVSVMLPNIPEMFEAHFAVPMCGAVLHCINTRLDADAIAFQLQHAETKVLIVDREYSSVIQAALAQLDRKPLVIDVDDPVYQGPGELLGEISHAQLLAEGSTAPAWSLPEDEWQSISLNYTSGTTGNPKGVVYHHRGAYLNAMGNVVTWDMGLHPVYLWTLPMFHCNGWCFPWTLAVAVGTNICLRNVIPETVFELIQSERVNHFCGAPVVMNMLINAPDSCKQKLDHEVKVMNGGAALPAPVIEKLEAMGVRVTHVYGLTETYGPSTVCAWHEEWNELPLEEQATLRARQGVRNHILEEQIVADPKTLQPVEQNGEQMGEVFMRGNNVMKGYLDNPAATEEAFSGGWFHSGDLAVWHPDGYIQIKDRSKDIIISGGENISTLEVESVLYKHPAVLEAAVVARHDDHWGETPCAFVDLKPDAEATEEEVIEFCRANLAKYKCPRHVVFGPLPKTSTGKIQKFVLRERTAEVA